MGNKDQGEDTGTLKSKIAGKEDPESRSAAARSKIKGKTGNKAESRVKKVMEKKRGQSARDPER